LAIAMTAIVTLGAALAARATVATELLIAAEITEEALERMVVGQFVEAWHVEGECTAATATVGNSVDLGLNAYADNSGRDLLDHIGEAGCLHAFHAHGIGQHRGDATGDSAEADRAGNCNRSGRRHQAAAGPGVRGR